LATEILILNNNQFDNLGDRFDKNFLFGGCYFHIAENLVSSDEKRVMKFPLEE